MKFKELYTKHFRAFLTAVRPDIVHFQHTLFLGFDLIREVRNTLPQAPILYTLHEFLPICNHYGQMIRTVDNRPCLDASPRRCHECYPEIAPERFFLRKRFVQAQLGLVDRFLAPSRFLLERYVDWGIARDRIVFEEYGRAGLPAPLEPTPRSRRNRIGFFGQLTPFKGAHVLLGAMEVLRDQGIDAHCFLHGANLDLQARGYRDQLEALLAATSDVATMVGPYDHDQLPQLMEQIDWIVIPSIWWENSPLVIQEAFAHGKPVICSDIGGMAEKVADGANGIHFRAGDPIALAAALREAVSVPGLWERLRAGIPPVYRMEDHIAQLTDIYTTVLAERSSGNGNQ
jgi:glycosyltransferase involved in cell wall biosynthesis